MDSHEEKVYQAVRQTQEREAKQKMREKAKELQRQRIETTKRGGKPMSTSGGYGPNSGGYGQTTGGFSGGPTIGETMSTPAEPPKPTYNQSM